jgi:hypothetical protein
MTDWNAFAKALLRSEMTQRKITAAELAKLLDQ